MSVSPKKYKNTKIQKYKNTKIETYFCVEINYTTQIHHKSKPMVVTGILVIEGSNDINIANNIADILRIRLRNKNMLLIKANDYLSDALKEKYEYENLLIGMNEKVQAQNKSLEILTNEIKMNRAQSQQTKLYHTSSF